MSARSRILHKIRINYEAAPAKKPGRILSAEGGRSAGATGHIDRIVKSAESFLKHRFCGRKMALRLAFHNIPSYNYNIRYKTCRIFQPLPKIIRDFGLRSESKH